MTDHQHCASKSRGRPKTFDREMALDKALELFWLHGYEATSLSDLVAATGAKAPTLYAEFTNKEGLFRAALDRYIEKFAAQRKSALVCPESCVAQGVENYFRSTAACFTAGDKPAGCFFICTSSALSAQSGEVAHMLQTRHISQQNDLNTFLLARQQAGEIHADTNVGRLSTYLACLLQGMSVRAREGASRQELDSIIDMLMLQWPVLIQPASYAGQQAGN
ncbi:TetR/AcrR family transcriptional regulator [Erwinia mallotivora]|uniref:TetR family transcriptional regulator n=1 Tax=Erwinia mallotivora TaxID=69222 RepID=A0A014MDA9_9GAMM|nr:TetR/AcrR family transcriptional regulator [Erwinia mallotivora]EXU76054.1 TetR family transcriptional regulator [Erwinia mallotivora]